MNKSSDNSDQIVQLVDEDEEHEEYIVMVDFSDSEGIDEDIERVLASEGSVENDMEDDFMALAGGVVYSNHTFNDENNEFDSTNYDLSFLEKSNPLMHKFLIDSAEVNSKSTEINITKAAKSEQHFEDKIKSDDLFDLLFDKTLKSYDDNAETQYSDDSHQIQNSNSQALKDVLFPNIEIKRHQLSDIDKDLIISFANNNIAQRFEKMIISGRKIMPAKYHSTKDLESTCNKPTLIRLISNRQDHRDSSNVDYDIDGEMCNSKISDNEDKNFALNTLISRRFRNETLEEKKARKSLVKHLKSEARTRKKQTKEQFKRAKLFESNFNYSNIKSLSNVC
ncbi:hypothetical protein GJ496_005271 [Pomphorhynchus laevis]|nr:hypothetical protein GJ496_005271 [Pomphorhynchus laevis]